MDTLSKGPFIKFSLKFSYDAKNVNVYNSETPPLTLSTNVYFDQPPSLIDDIFYEWPLTKICYSALIKKLREFCVI